MPTARLPHPLSGMLACLLLLMVLVLAPLTAQAAALAGSSQTAASGSGDTIFQQGPASSDQLALYARIASVNTCLATKAGEDFEQAAGIAGETIAQLILGIHQGLIETSGGTPLTLDELRTGSINAAVIGATEICPQQVPADLSKKVKQALTEPSSATAG